VAGYGLRVKATGNYNGILSDTSTNTGGGYFAAAKNGTRYSIFGTTGAWLGDTSTDTAIVSEAASSNIRFYTNGSSSESMRITSGGNVGIGTTSPSAPFHVWKDAGDGNSVMRIRNTNSTFRITTLQFEDYAGAYADGLISFNVKSGAAAGSYLGIGVSTTGSLVVAYGGNVGIGTVSPGSKLSVAGTLTATDTISSTSGTVTTYLTYTSTNGVVGTQTNHGLQIRTNDTARMFIDTSGNVGIGTTSPQEYLHIVGTNDLTRGVRFSEAGNNYRSGINWGSSGGANSGWGLDFYTPSSNTGTVTNLSLRGNGVSYFNAGNVGIATTSPSALLHVQGLGASPNADSVYITNKRGGYFPLKVLATQGDYQGVLIEHEDGTGSGGAGPSGSYGFKFDDKRTSGTYASHPSASFVIARSNTYNNTNIFEVRPYNSSPAIAVATGGNVGIGIASPAASLHVAAENNNNNGTIKLGARLWIQHNDSGNTTSSFANDYNSDSARMEFRMKGNTASDAKMTILGNGNVGIGTTSPTDELQVVTTSGNGITITTNDVATLKMRSSAGSTKNWGFATTNLAASDFGIYQSTSNGGDPISAGTARLYFDGNGNVGIGTTSPVYQLQVLNTIGLRANSTSFQAIRGTYWGYSTSYPVVMIGHQSTGSFTTVSIGYDPSGNANGAFSGDGREILFRRGAQFVTPNAADTSFNLYNLVLLDGNVGIGTATPVSTFQVAGTSTLGSSASNGDVTVISNSTPFLIKGRSTYDRGFMVLSWDVSPDCGVIITNSFKINVNATPGSNTGTVAMTITSGGNVGIGTTSPSEKLDLLGTFRQSTTSTQPMLIYGDSAATNGLFRVQIDEVNDSFGTGARTFLGDGGIDIFIGTGNSSYTPANTYIALNHSGEISMGAGSATKHLVISTSGNVGIGTTSFGTSLLNVNGNIGLAGDTTKYFYMPDVNQGTGSIYMQAGFGSSQAGGALRLYGHNATAYTGGDVEVGLSGKGNFLINSTIGGSRLVTVNINGNVGIGTTSPGSNLHIKGSNDSGADFGAEIRVWENAFGASLQGSTQGNTAAFVGNFRYNFTTAGSSIQNYPNAGQGILFKDGIHVYSSNPGGSGGGTFTPSERLTIKTDGNVGIGTTSPSSILHILDTSANDTTLIIGAAGEVPIIKAGGANTDLQIEAVGAGGYLNFVTNGTSRMLISGGGSVGIGTTSPTNKLHIVGGVTVNSTTPFTFTGNGNSGTYTQTAFYTNQNNTSNNTANGIFIERGRLSDSPSAEIRSFVIGDRGGAIQLLLDKDGKLTVTNDVVAYGSPSDISLKTNIKPLEGALEKIMQLQGVSFTWKEDTSENNLVGIKDDIGFIAQQVQEVLPDLVRKNDNGLLSLRDKGITALLVEAIKELKAEIDTLKNK
jgi:hypothetical protein